jgi:fructokinase
MYDVIAIGELLIDFTPAGKSEQGNPFYERNPGGAPANVLSGLARLGKHTAFIGKVGDDLFGHYLVELMAGQGIQMDGIRYSQDSQTTVVFVDLKDNGERSFSFYRKPGADQMLMPEELNQKMLSETRIFHFGSVSLTHEPSRSATLEAVRLAKQSGALISFDPNIRLSLWDDSRTARLEIMNALNYADIVKISEEELEFLTENPDVVEGSGKLHEAYQTKLIMVTLGSEGSFFRYGALYGHVSGHPVTAIDTTGAGDAFLSGVLFRILERGASLEGLTVSELASILNFGNIMGSIVVTRKGAILSMPSMEEIMEQQETKAG